MAPLTVQEGDASGSVNILSGALSLHFPIGPRYPVSEALSYGLDLTFSSANRRFLSGNIAPLTPRDFARGRSPVGWGWTLHFGRIADDPARPSKLAFQSQDGVWHGLEASSDPAICNPYASCHVSIDSTYIRAVHLPEGSSIPSPGDRWVLWTPDGVERELNKFVPAGTMCGAEVAPACSAQDDFYGWYTTGIFDPLRAESVTIEYEAPGSGKEHCIARVWDSVRGIGNPTLVFNNVEGTGQPGAVGGITTGVLAQGADSGVLYSFLNNAASNWVANPGQVCGNHNGPWGAPVNLLEQIVVATGGGGSLILADFQHHPVSRAIKQVDLPGDLARAEYEWQCIDYSQIKLSCDEPPGCELCEVDTLATNAIVEKRVYRGGGTGCLDPDVDCWTYERELEVDPSPDYYPCTGCVIATNPKRVTVTLPATLASTSPSVTYTREKRAHWFNQGLSTKLGVCPDPPPPNYRNGLERQVDFYRGPTTIVQSILTDYEIDIGDRNARVVRQETRYPLGACGGGETFTRREFSDFDGHGHYQVLVERTDEGIPSPPGQIARRTESRYERRENATDHDIQEWFLGRLVKREVYDGDVTDPLALVSQTLFDWDSHGRLYHENHRGLGHPDVQVHRGWESHRVKCETWSGGDTNLAGPPLSNGWVNCAVGGFGCTASKEVDDAFTIERSYHDGSSYRGAVTRRFYKGLGFNIERTERSARSGAAIAEHDAMDRYSKRLTRDPLDRVLQVDYLDNASADEAPLVLLWPSPTEVNWSRSAGPVGSVKYDAYGRRRQTRIDDPDDGGGPNDLVKVSYTDGSGNLRCEGDWLATSLPEPACAGEFHLQHDSLGRPARIQRGGIDQVAFDYCGMQTVERRFVQTGASEEQVSVVFERDGFGRLVKVTEPSPTGSNRVTEYTYDPMDRLLEVEMRDGSSVQVRSFEYDGLGNLRRATEPESGTTSYDVYDARGHLIESTDGRGVVTTRTYDCAERLVEEVADPPGSEPAVARRFTFDGDAGQYPGRLTATGSDHRGGPGQLVEQSFEYDGSMGRLSRSVSTLLGHEFDQTLTYNNLGLIATASYPDAVADRDPGRHVLELSHGYAKGFLDDLRDITPGHAFDYVRNIDRAPSGLVDYLEFGSTVPPYDQLYQHRWRDSRGRMSSITGHFASTVLFNTGAYLYDRSSNIIAIGPDTFRYFKDGSLKSASYPGQGINYGYDAFGNLTQRTGVEPFSLTVSKTTNQITTGGFDYSDSGNLILDPERSYTWDALNRIYGVAVTASGMGAYSLYNASGDRFDLSTDAGCTDGRLFTIRGPEGRVLSDYWSNSTSCSTAATWLRDYVYAGGDLVATRTNATLAAPWMCPKVCCPDPGDCYVDVATFDASANACRSDGVNVYQRTAIGTYDYDSPINAAPLLDGGCTAPGTIHAATTMGSCYRACSVHKSGALGECGPEVCPQPLPPFNCSNDCVQNCGYSPPLPPKSIRVAYHITDHLGSPRLRVSSAGVIEEELKLGPFGETLDPAGCEQRSQFTVHERDSLTNLDYMRARFFAASMGRFLSVDPVRGEPSQPGRWNAYAYVQNNPVGTSDPTGLEPSWGQRLVAALRDGYLAAAGTVTAAFDKFEEAATVKVGPDTRSEDALEASAEVGERDFKAAQQEGWDKTAGATRMIAEGVAQLGVAKIGGKPASTRSGVVSGGRSLPDLVSAARKAHPGKAGKIEKHHIKPKYLGGDPKGPRVPIDAAYHQEITNAFRNEWGYGRGRPSSAQVTDIMKEVYEKFPLPEQ